MSNDDKSVWEPCQENFWLGIIWQELDQYTKDEIIFWKDNIDLVKSRFCFSDKNLTYLGSYPYFSVLTNR